MRQRSFEIIRVPELEGTAFLFNNVRVHYVGTNPENGISFYCSLTQNYGVKVYPDGQKALENASGVKYGHNEYSHGKAEYLKFRHAFGNLKGIFVSHAVWMAAGRTIPPGYTIDHINGCTTDNNIRNLRCIDNDTNNRDGGFLRKLRNKGIDPKRIYRHRLLQYYDRMAILKNTLSVWYYRRLTRNELEFLLTFTNQAATGYFNKKYNIKIQFKLCQTTLKNCAD